MKKEIKSTKTEDNGIDVGKMTIALTSLIVMTPMAFPNLNINLSQIANSMTGLGYALTTGGVTYFSLSLIKDFISSKNENEVENSDDKGNI